ncbi:MAG: N-acetyltransferase [Anaerolineales bacterium]|nr:N-acetyltransferase [Anaerolineae bacterium]PWB51805.1 MAG: N-acetyltransferase [Anaerolineales bacterium]
MKIRIHPTADVSPRAVIGDSTCIWHQAQIREDVVLGQNCIIGKGVYIDAGVKIGNNVKIQNYTSVYHGVTIEDGVFIGPHVCFTNDLKPRAINPDGSLKDADDWILTTTLVQKGAALGANSTIRCGVTIGEWSMIGCGSVITRDIPNYGLAWGNPARLHGFVCPCGTQLEKVAIEDGSQQAVCPACGIKLSIPMAAWELVR